MRINAEATTREMNEAVEGLEELCEKSGVALKLGGYIGKHPQTLILDYNRYNSDVRVDTGEYHEPNVHVKADGTLGFGTHEDLKGWRPDDLTPEHFKTLLLGHDWQAGEEECQRDGCHAVHENADCGGLE